MNQVGRQSFLHWEQKHLAIYNNNNDKKQTKSTKMCVIKQKLIFEYYKHCFKATQVEDT